MIRQLKAISLFLGICVGVVTSQTCRDGTFGGNCLRNCSANCISDPCNHVTGECERCTNGWKGFNCTTECSKGKFGLDCSESCDGCIESTCDRFNGECVDNSGCKPGYEYGRYCNKTCSKGKFGLNCSESCDGCIGSTCDRLNGECVDSTGCKPGYEYGRYCNKTCVDWHFGTKCTKICYCLNNPCDKSSGNCLDGGCKKGWHGQSCDETCSKGTFGFDCSESCDGCIESTCDRFNGECVDSTGCKAGYEYGRYCNETCSTGKYGLDCSESCDGCIESKCDRLTGDCFYSYGCKPGYEYGRYCNRTIPKCDKGKFGLYCTESCDGCIESICNRCDGVCIDSSGCKPGYEYGPYCNKTCMDWHFGTNCTKMCYCLNNPCEKTSGICSDGGCNKGWHGQSCDEECSKGTFGLDCSESCDGCIESACDRFNGECVDSSGCKSGYEHGPYCNKNTQMSLPASSGTAIRGGISAAIMIIIIKIFEVNYVI